jgi:DNA uptake protein ComE-like DNA-binding protein
MKNIFQLTRNERLGFLGIGIIFFGMLVFKYFDSKLEVKHVSSSLELNQSKNPDAEVLFLKKSETKITEKIEKSELRSVLKPFEKFNPNTVTNTYWEKIGLQPKMAKRINKFIKSGNGIDKASELLVIYGFKKEWLKDIEAYLVFKKIKIDLNVANAFELQLVKGIGEVLSARILKFRDKLGGFTSCSQLYQVYGIDSVSLESSMDRFEIKKPWKKIRINQASLQELESHLYLNFIQSEEIIKIRSISGEIDSSQIRNIFTTSEWIKIKPYFKWEN